MTITLPVQKALTVEDVAKSVLDFGGENGNREPVLSFDGFEEILIECFGQGMKVEVEFLIFCMNDLF